jgi:hypothetical protein
MSEMPSAEKGFVNRAKSALLLGRPDVALNARPEFQSARPEIRKAFHESWVWHGTGRFQYDPEDRSKIRDVLADIVDENGLVPHTDVLDFTQGEMESISTSPAWLYSLMYAQYHYETGKSVFDAKRNALIWSRYLAPMSYRSLNEALLKRNPDYTPMLAKKNREEFKDAAKGFHNKATVNPGGKAAMIRGGVSDIPGNYPILIGIRTGAFQPRPIAGALDKHEVRSPTPITTDDFTNIQVPTDKVGEVSAYLQSHEKGAIPVFPIEWAVECAKSEV